MKIGELAELAECSVETVRYYEQQGLIPEPRRSEGNYRVYEPDHVSRLALIRQCRALDMSIEEVKTVLGFVDAPSASCADVNAVLDAHIVHVSERVAELQILERQLKNLRDKCRGENSVAECGILLDLSSTTHHETLAKRSPASHVRASKHVG